ncbi:MAG: type IV secretory system conjugative DNA transfer family protein [Bacteroidetes bacterium]|nr:type IV secretory system conjugative DNA transfer family protein [Bacteroidota bacterium]
MMNKFRVILGLASKGNTPVWSPTSGGSRLVLAATGGGKTTCVAIPTILSLIEDRTRAMMIIDAKNGEIASQIGPTIIKSGRRFAVLDDTRELGPDYPYRIRVNPFGNVIAAYESGSPNLVFEIENVAHTLIDEPNDDPKNFYFRQVPRQIIECALLALLRHSKSLATPGGLSAFLADTRSWRGFIDRAAEGDDPVLRQRAGQIRELRDKDPEHYSQHMLAALSALGSFQIGSPLHEAGRNAELTHEEVIRDHWVVCIVQNQNVAARLGTYFGLHILSFMAAQMNGAAGAADYILDEFCNAPLREALNRVTVMRGYGGRFHFIGQSFADVERRYGLKEAAMLAENCTTKQYLKFSSFEESERVSKAMGEVISITDSLSMSSNPVSLGMSLGYQMGRERTFTAEELMRLSEDEQILHIAGIGWIHCRKIRQNQIAPYCFELAGNPLEGGKLTPDPKIDLSPRQGRKAS